MLQIKIHSEADKILSIVNTRDSKNIKIIYEKNISKIDMTTEFWGAATTKVDSHTRAFLKIQDGFYEAARVIILQKKVVSMKWSVLSLK